MSSIGHLPEMELLRGQVADLSRELAERDRVAQDLREQSDLLRAIAAGTAAETGEEFFSALVTHLTSVLKVQYAIIGEVQGDCIKKIHTLAVSDGGALVDNFEYELAHTPCATALTQTFTCFDRDVQATFPQFQRLADLGAESYCAVPLRTKNGAVIGLLVVMDMKPLERSDDLQSLLGVFAPRIAAEFERRRAEQENAQALADLLNVIETIPDIVFALNTQGNMVKWNRRVGEVTGYSPEELLHKPALAFVPPEEQARTAAAIQRAFTEGYAELDGQLLTKDLHVIPYHWTGALLKNSHGEPVGITGIGRDVSGKKRVEEALRESEQRFALAVDGSNDILWDAHLLPGEPWHAPQTSIWWSPRVQELLDLEESESFETIEQWVARIHPDDKDRVFGHLAAHIGHRVPYDVEYRLRTNRGDYRWIRGRGQALWDEQGKPRRMSGSCQDITDRKWMEEERRKQEVLITLMLNTGPACIKRVAADGLLLHMNPTGLKMVEACGEPEVVGRSVFDLITPTHREAFIGMHRSVIEGHERTLQFEIQGLKGTRRWVESYAVPFWNPVTGQTEQLAVTHDITERKQVEEALRKSKERYAQATAAGRVGVWELDVATGTYHGDLNLKGLFGYLDDELSTDPYVWLNLVHRDDQSIAMDNWQRIVNGERDDCNYELRMFKKDGTIIWTDIRGHAVRDHEGQVTQVFGTTVDITERKQAQDALALSEHQLRTVLGALPVGVWFTDRSGKPLLVNPMAKQIWSNIKHIGLQNPDNSAGWWETVERATGPHRWALSPVLTTGVSSLNETLEIECLDGTKKTIHNSTVPVRDETGILIGAIVLNEDITTLRQAQKALKLTQFSVDHAVEGFFWISPDAKVLQVNEAACRMLEYTRDELTAMTVHDIDPDFSLEAWPTYWDKLKEKGSLTFETKYWSKTGRVLDTEVTVNYLQYEGNEYSCAIMRDIGERKRVEAALRLSEQRYASLLNSVTGIVWEADPATFRFTFVSIQAEHILGYPVQQWLNDPSFWPEHILPEDRERCVAYCVEQTKLGLPHDFEYRMLAADGRTVWIRDIVSVFVEEGCPVKVRGIMLDITEQKRAEEELRLSHAFLRQVIDSDPNFIFAKDREGRFTLVNKAVADAYGTTVDNLIGKTDADFNPNQEEVAFFRQRDLEVMDTLHERFLPEEVITDSDGRTRWLQTVKRPILDEEGRATMVLGASTDITERKHMEETLHQRERALRAAIEERERISQDLHDGILQSLFAVGLTLEASKLTMSPTARKTSGLPLNQAIDQLNRVMREIRLFIAGLGSDLLQGKDLSMALQRMLALLAQNQATRVRLAVENRAAKSVSAEQSLHLFLVIQEAVSNCIRHGRAQEARVSLKMLKQGVRLSIRDNGRGFNQNAAKKTGHGLANMAARAQKIGGRFTVLSKVNEGTRIVLDLPNEVADVRS